MSKIDIDSVRLTRQLRLCSSSLSKAISRFKDIKYLKRENDVIVFVTNSPNLIKKALQKSLEENGIALDYMFTTVNGSFSINTTTQVFLTTSDMSEATRLRLKNSKFIIVDITNRISFQKIDFYMELMVKNINTNIL